MDEFCGAVEANLQDRMRQLKKIAVLLRAVAIWKQPRYLLLTVMLLAGLAGSNLSRAVTVVIDDPVQFNVTSPDGNVTLQWGTYQEYVTVVTRYKNGVFDQNFFVHGAYPSLSETLSAGSYAYEISYCPYLTVSQPITCYYEVSPLIPGELTPIAHVQVNVTAPPPPSVPPAPAFSNLSHPGTNSDSNGLFGISWAVPGGNPTSYELQQRINGGTWASFTPVQRIARGVASATEYMSIGCGHVTRVAVAAIPLWARWR